MRVDKLLYDVRALVVDLDGVVWLGGSPIRENTEALRRLIECGYRVVFLTNNSARSRRAYSLALAELGLEVDPGLVVTSGYSASLWLKRKLGRARVYPVGEEGLVEELVMEGHLVLGYSSSITANAVVVGLDRNLTYGKVEAALAALAKGALFVATNRDHVLPTESGPKPGAGAIVSMLETASRRRIDFDAGKPNPWILEIAMKAAGVQEPREVAVIGDRLDTDVEMARRAGAVPVLVLTGLTREDDIQGLESGNTIIVRNLGELGLC